MRARLAERDERVPEVEAEVDGLLERLAGSPGDARGPSSACSKQRDRLAVAPSAPTALAPAWRR